MLDTFSSRSSPIAFCGSTVSFFFFFTLEEKHLHQPRHAWIKEKPTMSLNRLNPQNTQPVVHTYIKRANFRQSPPLPQFIERLLRVRTDTQPAAICMIQTLPSPSSISCQKSEKSHVPPRKHPPSGAPPLQLLLSLKKHQLYSWSPSPSHPIRRLCQPSNPHVPPWPRRRRRKSSTYSG